MKFDYKYNFEQNILPFIIREGTNVYLKKSSKRKFASLCSKKRKQTYVR